TPHGAGFPPISNEERPMKLKSWLGAAVLLAMLASTSHAAETLWIGANGGFAAPTGDFGDVANSGFGLGLTGDFPVNPVLALGGELGYYSFGGDQDFEDATSAYLSAIAGTPI